jgi:hypothetical protein
MFDSVSAARALASPSLTAPAAIALNASLSRAGLLIDGRVPDLASVDEGLRFVGGVAAALPEGWDLLDAFSGLDFGPWRPDGCKDINASLRSLGMFGARWRGNKWDALWHPIPSRATAVLDYDRLLSEGALSAAGLRILFPSSALSASRLQVEVGVLEMYLRRDEWWSRLWPALDRELQDEEAQIHLGEGLFYGAAARRVSCRLGEEVLESGA